MCGNDPRLGSWDVRKGVFMRCQVSAHALASPLSLVSSRRLGASSRYETRAEPSDPFTSPNPPVASPTFLALVFTHASEPPTSPPRTQHLGEGELLWTGSVTGHFVGSFDYRYAVVDRDMNVVRWDAFARHAHFAPAMPEGRGGGSDDNSDATSVERGRIREGQG